MSPLSGGTVLAGGGFAGLAVAMTFGGADPTGMGVGACVALGVGVGVAAANAADIESPNAATAAHGVIRNAIFMLRPRLKTNGCSRPAILTLVRATGSCSPP